MEEASGRFEQNLKAKDLASRLVAELGSRGVRLVADDPATNPQEILHAMLFRELEGRL